MKAPQQRWLLRSVGGQLARLAVLLLAVAVWGGGVTSAAIAIQAQRDETRSVDLLLVIAPDIPPTALIAHSLDLYRRGYSDQIAIAGPGRERARADLIGRGVPKEAIVDPAASASPASTLATAHQAGVRSLLVVSSPASQLLSLKIAHDLGMRAYGSPVPAQAIAPLDMFRATLSYWRYALTSI